MFEDPLLRNQRIRLEALKQAVQHIGPVGGTAERVVEHARRFEDYIKDGGMPDATR